MATVTADQDLFFNKNDTAPVIEIIFTKKDRNTVVPLTGYSGFVSFWVPGSAPHVVRQGQVDGVNGIVRYFPRGDEFATKGQLRFQATVFMNDFTVTAVGQGFFMVSGEKFHANVIERPT